jgi:molecular chaperone DnaK (HSP70)
MLKLTIQMKILMPAEPEAACQMATINDPVSLWERVMIVDCGGGTIDITIHDIGERLQLSCRL